MSLDQAFITEIDLMLRAKYPLIYIVTAEEEPVDGILQRVATLAIPQRQVLVWDIVTGWHDNFKAKGSIMAALERISNTKPQESIIFVLRDLHFILQSPQDPRHAPVIRAFRNLIAILKRSRNTVILTSYTLTIPPELREDVTILDFPLPHPPEIDGLLDKVVDLRLQGLAREQLVKACQGLSRARIQRVLAKAIAAKGYISEQDIALILDEKKQAIRQTGILQFLPVATSLKSVGGLDNLKQWVRMRSQAFSDQARRYGLPIPKGVLLAGIQGTGKSLCAKTIASEWRLPLLRLDTGRLFGGIVGESESRVRQMIQIAEAVAPCILWIDEIDKAFGNLTTGVEGDSGTSRRVFGSLITWMQEKTAAVFIVATANNVQILPAELLRKGRFDELFFLNLPSERDRAAIFKVHLQRLRPSRLREFDLSLLARQTPDFSGAEIQQVIVDAMHLAFAAVIDDQRRDFTTEDIIQAIQDTVPLAAIAREQVMNLRQWATQAGAKTAAKSELSG